MEARVVPRAAGNVATVAEAFRLTADRRPDDVAVRTVDDAVRWTWSELRTRVDALASALHRLGLRPGDALALQLGSRPEFHLADLAAMMVGATPFSVYLTSAPGQIAYVVGDAGARIMITEQAHLAAVLEARGSLPDLEHLIVVDGGAPDGVLTLEELAPDPAFDVAASVAALAGDDVLTLIYTSGTTGPPKGVELTHRNVLAAVSGMNEVAPFPQGGRVISWLPNAHIAERAGHHYLPMVFGLEITCCPDPREIIAVLPQVRPHWFFAVPRIWEKLKAALEAMLAGLPAEQRAPLQTAMEAALRKVRLEQAGEPVPDELAATVARADAERFAGLRTMLGLDEVQAIYVGAAATPVEVVEFFHAIGLPLAEGWGMSESCGVGTVNPPDRVKIGTVGPPIPGAEVKLADDGELLLRGGVVMLGYRGLPDQTREAIDADGWLHTGDVATIDAVGYVTIVDRKKELIINSAGKNMSPANIEATLKAASPLIGAAVCIGDARPYNTALIVLEGDGAQLAGDPRVRDAVREAVDVANAKLARVEQIKRFTIVEGEWLPGGDELTPTMKLKRRPIADKYAELIEAMYVG